MKARLGANVWVLAGAALGAAVPVILMLWPSSSDSLGAFPVLWKYWSLSGSLLIGGLGVWLLSGSRLAGYKEIRVVAGLGVVLALLVGIGTFAVFGKLWTPGLAKAFAAQKPKKVEPQAVAASKPAAVKPAATDNPAASKTAPAGTPPAPKPSPEEQELAANTLAAGLLRSNCLGRCHNYGGQIGGSLAASDLKKYGEQRTMSYMIQVMRDPFGMGIRGMPKPNLTDEEIYAIAKFLSGRGGNKGQEKPWFGNYVLDMSPEDMIKEGRKRYEFFNCQNCHKINKKGGDMGPDLSTIGSQRDAAWIESFLTSPQTVKPGTMQPFLPMAVDEIKQIAAYLASLK